MATEQATKNCITLKGSAQIIVEYLKYGINAILFQRRIYPTETFENTQKYGLTVLISKDKTIEEFLQKVLRQTEEWLVKNMIEKICMVITNAYTQEVLECWNFKMQAESGKGGATELTSSKSNKDMSRIQKEIRDVMRQISASVSYMPLLDCICTFDIFIQQLHPWPVPDDWDQTDAIWIPDAQVVQLRSFSTGLHKIETVVNYKMPA